MSMLSIVNEVSMEDVVESTVDPAEAVTSDIVVLMNMYARPASEMVIIKMRIIAITSETPSILVIQLLDLKLPRLC
jgi:hypothetical protein